MRLGIDFGTTNSSIARFDGQNLFRLRIDPANDNPHVLPSLIYVDREQRAVVGTRAALEYLNHETGRTVKWAERRVGEIDVVAADMSYVQTVNVLVDTAAHGRLLQYVKTALRDPTYQGTQIFDRFYTIDELITLILYPLKRMAEQAFAEECTGVVIGRPVRFSEDPAVTARAEEILYKAARWAGFRDIRFELEPVGATLHYHRAAPRRQTAFIFDFGGGTLDLTVAEVGGNLPPRILATHGVLVGGDDLDRRVMQSLRKYFGAQPRGEREPAPPHLLELLDNWQTMPLLSRPAMLKLLDELKAHCDLDAIAALRALVTRNASEPLQFDLGRPARVFVAYDATAHALPAWLKDFSPHSLPIVVEQWQTERAMRLYFRDYAAGRVTLGGNRAEDQRGELFLNYFVILQAALE